MNNLSSYCGLVDAKIRASDKDLPVFCYQNCSDLLREKIVLVNEKTSKLKAKNLQNLQEVTSKDLLTYF